MASHLFTLNTLRRWAVVGPIIFLLAVSAVVSFLRPATGEILGAPGMIIGLVTGATLLVRRTGRLARRERLAWLYFAAGMYSVAAGVLSTAVLSMLGRPVPAFGALDVSFVVGYSMFLVALYRLARSAQDGRDWILTILDAMVGAIALGALIWTMFYNELVASLTRGPTWERLVASAYPLLDIAAVVALMILVIRRSNFHWDPRLVFLAAGFSIQMVADLLYLQRGVGQTFAEAQPVYGLFLLVTACLLATGALVDRVPRRRDFSDSDAPVLALIWPYLLVASLLGTHVVRYHAVSRDIEGRFLLDALLVIGAIALVRQMVISYRQRTRVENQRSELVASVSHELRTPLTAMVGYLSLLDESGDEFAEDVRREMVSEAASQARHMARLVTDLVMMARGDHLLPLEITEESLASVTRRALRSVNSEGVLVEEDLADDFRVRVDGDRIRQALANLLTNAVRYGGDRALIAGRASGRDLILEVHDNGKGLSNRHEARVWERFERGAHRLDASTPGMGIGLAIVKAVAEAHGGAATYRKSEILGGACFSLTIPECVVGSAMPVQTTA